MAGELVLARVGQAVQADIKLQITYSSKGLQKGWTWIPQLGPSRDLFAQYMDWCRAGLWPAMWEEYRLAFEAELNQPRQQAYLKRIALRIQQGRRVAIACFCPEERFCHRSLVAAAVKKLL